MSVAIKSSELDINLEQVAGYAKGFDEHKTAKKLKALKKKSWFQDFLLLFDMIRDKNFHLKSSSYLTIAGALAYVVLPTDIIPDFLPLIGWLDDTLVLKLALDATHDEIKRFKEYKHK